MDAGLVVVSVVLGGFLLVPLVLAWVSTDPRRWARVEKVLGREPPAGVLSPGWAAGLWTAMGATYIALGIGQARTDEPDGFPWLSLALGIAWMLNAVFQYVVLRRRQAAARSAQTQVQDRAEPGRPGAGG
jgi:hypothetical protein